MSTIKKGTKRLSDIFLIVASVFVNIKSVFCDYNPDSAYTVAMAYRKIQGDRMLAEMWEPHQTSIFPVEALMRVYRLFVPSLEGVVIWLQIWGAIAFLLVSIGLYKLLSSFSDKRVAFYSSVFFFCFRPKFIVNLEYTNLVVIFSTLLFIFLTSYYLRGRRNNVFLFLAVLSYFLTTIVYPTAAIVIIPVIVIIALRSKSPWEDYGYALGLLVVLGPLYLFWVCGNQSIVTTVRNVIDAVKSDSHSVFHVSGWAYFRELCFIFAILAVVCFIGIAVTVLKNRRFDKGLFAETVGPINTVAFLLVMFVFYLKNPQGGFGWMYLYFGGIILVIFVGIFGYRLLDYNEKRLYDNGIFISTAVMIAVMILSDLPFVTVLGYVPLAVSVSFIPIYRLVEKDRQKNGLKDRQVFLVSFLILMIVHKGFFIFDISWDANSVLKIENFIRKGPEKYICTTLEYCNKEKVSVDEWKQNVLKNDKVLIVDGFGWDPTDYLLTEAGNSNSSTNSNPVYSKLLLLYWDKYMEKRPTIIAIPCWQGKEGRNAEEWIYKYVEDNFYQSYKGKYWNFYRKRYKQDDRFSFRKYRNSIE